MNNKKALAFAAAAAAGLFAQSALAQAGSTVTITPNANAASSSSETVTMGVPVAACLMPDPAAFRLLDHQGNPVSVFVKPTLRWHMKSDCPNAVRALKVQFTYDATGGSRTYNWDLGGRNLATDIAERPVAEIASPRSMKGGFSEPRVFAVLPPSYLINSQIVPPTVAQVPSTYDDGYLPYKWEYDSRDFDYTSSSAANWLFDRVTTNYRQALRRGDIEYYREAYLSHEFWIDKMEDTGANTTFTDYCIGGFDYGSKAQTFGSGGSGCDTKYIYLEPVKLHLALTGDDTWQPTGTASGLATTRNEMWIETARTLYSGENRGNLGGAVPAAGFSSPYQNIGSHFTERKSGFGLQALVNSCELSGDATVCGWVDQVVDRMHQMQTANPDGRGNLGYLPHSWHEHEGSFRPFIGVVESTSGTQLVVEDTLGTSNALQAGNTVRVGSSTYTVASVSNLGGNRWNITLTSSISVSAGTRVIGGSEGGSEVNYELETDRVFSPWTQSIVADGLWQYYWMVDDLGQKQKAKDLLLGFARAYAAYAVDGTRMLPATKATLENAFGVSIFDSEISSKAGCGLTKSPYTRYVANDLMTGSAMTRSYSSYMFNSGGFADQHTPEGIFQLALGIFFETDEVKRNAMVVLAQDLIEWFDRYTCTAGNRARGGAISDPPRAWSWQNKADPFGTYCFAVQGVAAPDPGLIFREGFENSAPINAAACGS